jgi:DNA-binding MarR family transcriptional regulator
MTSQVLTPQQVSSPALAAWARLLRSHAATTRAFSTELTARHGLTINDYEALLFLSRAEGNHLKRIELADALQLTPSGITRLLEGLEKAGYVEKGTCSTDARVTYAVLTERGAEKLAEASESHLAAVQSLFASRLSTDELTTLADLLGRLPGAGGVDGTSCSPTPS